MPFYLWTGNYTADAMKAMVKKPSDREAAARQAVESVGGKLHHMFVSLGRKDLVLLAEFPDDVGAASISLMTAAAGAVANAETTRLMSMADFAKAMKKAGAAGAKYKPPQG
jgi:uncharacterized protein with GYD domain